MGQRLKRLCWIRATEYNYIAEYVGCLTRMLFVLRHSMKVCALRTQSAAGVKAAVENTSPLIR